MSKTFIVIGCPRSGTSLLAGLLYHLGVNMGDNLREADRFNPRGYFEDLEILILNGRIYLEAGGREWSEDFRVRKSRLDAVGKEYVEIIKKVVEKKNRRPIWGAKGGMNFTLEFWLPHLRSPRILLI